MISLTLLNMLKSRFAVNRVRDRGVQGEGQGRYAGLHTREFYAAKAA